MSFGAHPWALGVEEELLVLDRDTLALAPDAPGLLERTVVPASAGGLKPDTYAAEIELVSPVSPDAATAVGHLRALRAALRAEGATLAGCGIHPSAPYGEVVHAPGERYAAIVAQLRGLIGRTPTAALHVHVGMPDQDTALDRYHALREWLPLLQALAASSPWWFGRDSGLASARAQLFRGYPRGELPPAFPSWDAYETTVAEVVAAGDAEDYTFLWWDLRPHARLGTVEVRAMDAQASADDVQALAALVHGLACHADAPARPTSRAGLSESSFVAARDGVRASLLHRGARRPVPDVLADALRAAGDPAEGEVLHRLVAEGGGAGRMRADAARGGLDALLRGVVERTQR